MVLCNEEILSFMVPEECSLNVQTALYLKKVNWSNIVTKCPLHPNRNFEFFWVSKNVKRFFYVQVPEECLLNVQTVLYLKKVNWSNIVSKCPLHPNRNFEFFWVSRDVKRFFYVQIPEECSLMVQPVLYLKKVNWSNIVSKCSLHPNRNFEFFWVSRNVKRFFYVQVPEECLLMVQTVLYLKKVNWSNIVTKCPLHPNRNFEFFWVSKNVNDLFMFRYLKSVT